MRILSFYFLFIVIGPQAFAQTAIRHQSPAMLRVEDLWNITISNRNQSSYEVYLKGTIKEQNEGEVFTARTASFSIEPGDWSIDLALIYPIQEQLNRRPLAASNQQLPNGRYWFETQLLEVGTDRVIGRVLSKSDIKDSPDLSSFQPVHHQKPKTNGQAHLTYLGQSPVLSNSTYPTNLFRGDLQLNAQVFKIPVMANGLYMSRTSAGNPSPNQLQFSFDKATLRHQLTQWLIKKGDADNVFDSLDNTRINNYRTMLREKKYPNLENWKGQLDSLDMDEKIAESQQLPYLEAALKNESLNKQLLELDSLKKQYNIDSLSGMDALPDSLSNASRNRLKQLFYLEKSVKELKAKEERLSKEKKKIRKYENVYQKARHAEEDDMGSLIKSDKDIGQGLSLFGYKNKFARGLLNVDEFNVGSVYPYFGQLSLNGVEMKGGNMAYTTQRNWHIGIAAGRTSKRNQIDTLSVWNSFESPYRQTFLGGQIGYGKPEENHFYMTYLQVKENGGIAKTADGFDKNPAENFVAAASFFLKDRNDRISFSGEYSTSLLNPNRKGFAMNQPALSGLGKIFQSKTKVGASNDDAFQFNLNVNLFDRKTDANFSIQKIGAGYKSLGAQFLLEDLFRYEGRLTHRFAKNKISISTFYKKDFDQLSPLAKLYRTYSSSWGAQGNVKLSKNLTTSLQYSPISQYNTSSDTSRMFNRKGQLFQSSVQYRKHKKRGFVSQLGWIYRVQHVQDTVLLFNNSTFSFTQQIIGKKWSTRLVGHYSTGKQKPNALTNSYVLDVSVAGKSLIKKAGTITLGIQYFNQKPVLFRDGFYIMGSLPINRFWELYAEYRRNFIRQTLGDRKETWQNMGRIGINLIW